jgi:hypothetical protein
VEKRLYWQFLQIHHIGGLSVIAGVASNYRFPISVSLFSFQRHRPIVSLDYLIKQ